MRNKSPLTIAIISKIINISLNKFAYINSLKLLHSLLLSSLFAGVRQDLTPLIHITHLTWHECQEHAAVSGNDVAFGASGD